MDKISVIVPIYNAEKYLNKCIKSILNQTYKNIEVILIDDGSIDNSPQICDQMSLKDSRIKVIHKQNEGLTMARKTGISVATGNFIGFVDADDWISLNMYSLLYKAISKYEADIASCRMVKDFPDNSHEVTMKFNCLKVLSKIEALKNMNLEQILDASLANKLIRKELFQNVIFRPTVTIGEDYRTSYYLIDAANKIVCIPSICYHYVQRQSSMCFKGYNNNGNAILNSYTEIKEQMIKNYPETKFSALQYYILQEMAVIISMIKADNYDFHIINRIKKDIRKNLFQYIRYTSAPTYLKICAILLSINEKFLINPYKLIFSKQLSKKMKERRLSN